MTTLVAIYSIAGLAISSILGVLVVSSWRESQLRATRISFALWLIFTGGWFGAHFLFQPDAWFYLFSLGLILIFTILWLAPIGRTDAIRIGRSGKRVDERDVIFARAEYNAGSDRYRAYYARRPENECIDDKLRQLPELFEPGGQFYDPVDSGRINDLFAQIEGLTVEVDGAISETRTQKSAGEWTQIVKRLVRNLGADAVGIARLNPSYLYSHVGRGPDKWGEQIDNTHEYAIVFTLEMDNKAVEAAPGLPISEESATQYLKGAQISTSLAKLIRRQGFSARAHVAGSNYQIMLPPVAYDAGLGELGRMGYLISEKLGPRMRLGAVTTSLPLEIDHPVSFGVQDFCRRCKKCAENCPSASIPQDGVSEVRGVYKWQLDIEQCYRYWRVAGTDCGLCMRVCPYSHPPTFIHNLIRTGLRRSAFARQVSVWGDDLLYGRRIREQNNR